MTLREIQYVVALADAGHFGRAAAHCHVAQPTLSGQIKKLEDYLGVALFERHRRGVRVTDAGAAIVAQARVVVEEAARLRALAQAQGNPMAGKLRLGVIPTLGPYYLPYLLPRQRAQYPQLHVLWNEDLTERLLDKLVSGRLDAALLALPVHGDGLVHRELFFEPFVAALPVGHPLAQDRPLHERELRGQPLLLLEDGHCLRDQALAVCGWPRGAAEEMRATSLETLRQMVAAGLGCTLLPYLAANGTGLAVPDNTLHLRGFSAPVPGRTIGLVWRTRYPREAALLALSELVQASLPPGLQVRPGAPRKSQRFS